MVVHGMPVEMTLGWLKGWRGIIATIAASRACVGVGVVLNLAFTLAWIWAWACKTNEYGAGGVGLGVFCHPSIPPSITSSFSVYIMGVRR